jgi:hypothetical protein
MSGDAMSRFPCAIALATLLTLPAGARGETHQFQILKDDPETIAGKIVSLNIANAHFSDPEGLKLGAGAEVLWNLPAGLQAQGNFVLNYVSINDAGGINYDLEAGAAYPLYRKTKTDDIKIILKHSESKSTVGSVTTKTTETEFIPSKGSFLVQGKARGGFYTKRAGMDVGDGIRKETTSFSALGAYAGFELTSQASQFTEVDGRKGVTSGLTRVYVDGMILPVASYDEQGSADDPGIFGARAGLAAYFSPSGRNHPEYGRLDFLQMFPTLFFKSEVGMRGGEGWFFNIGAGLMVFRAP